MHRHSSRTLMAISLAIMTMQAPPAIAAPTAIAAAPDFSALAKYDRNTSLAFISGDPDTLLISRDANGTVTITSRDRRMYLFANYKLMSIDGQPVRDLTIQKIQALLHKPYGTSVTLQFYDARNLCPMTAQYDVTRPTGTFSQADDYLFALDSSSGRQREQFKSIFNKNLFTAQMAALIELETTQSQDPPLFTSHAPYLLPRLDQWAMFDRSQQVIDFCKKQAVTSLDKLSPAQTLALCDVAAYLAWTRRKADATAIINGLAATLDVADNISKSAILATWANLEQRKLIAPLASPAIDRAKLIGMYMEWAKTNTTPTCASGLPALATMLITDGNTAGATEMDDLFIAQLARTSANLDQLSVLLLVGRAQMKYAEACRKTGHEAQAVQAIQGLLDNYPETARLQSVFLQKFAWPTADDLKKCLADLKAHKQTSFISPVSDDNIDTSVTENFAPRLLERNRSLVERMTAVNALDNDPSTLSWQKYKDAFTTGGTINALADAATSVPLKIDIASLCSLRNLALAKHSAPDLDYLYTKLKATTEASQNNDQSNSAQALLALLATDLFVLSSPSELANRKAALSQAVQKKEYAAVKDYINLSKMYAASGDNKAATSILQLASAEISRSNAGVRLQRTIDDAQKQNTSAFPTNLHQQFNLLIQNRDAFPTKLSEMILDGMILQSKPSTQEADDFIHFLISSDTYFISPYCLSQMRTILQKIADDPSLGRLSERAKGELTTGMHLTHYNGFDGLPTQLPKTPSMGGEMPKLVTSAQSNSKQAPQEKPQAPPPVQKSRIIIHQASIQPNPQVARILDHIHKDQERKDSQAQLALIKSAVRSREARLAWVAANGDPKQHESDAIQDLAGLFAEYQKAIDTKAMMPSEAESQINVDTLCEIAWSMRERKMPNAAKAIVDRLQDWLLKRGCTQSTSLAKVYKLQARLATASGDKELATAFAQKALQIADYNFGKSVEILPARGAYLMTMLKTGQSEAAQKASDLIVLKPFILSPNTFINRRSDGYTQIFDDTALDAIKQYEQMSEYGWGTGHPIHLQALEMLVDFHLQRGLYDAARQYENQRMEIAKVTEGMYSDPVVSTLIRMATIDLASKDDRKLYATLKSIDDIASHRVLSGKNQVDLAALYLESGNKKAAVARLTDVLAGPALQLDLQRDYRAMDKHRDMLSKCAYLLSAAGDTGRALMIDEMLAKSPRVRAEVLGPEPLYQYRAGRWVCRTVEGRGLENKISNFDAFTRRRDNVTEDPTLMAAMADIRTRPNLSEEARSLYEKAYKVQKEGDTAARNALQRENEKELDALYTRSDYATIKINIMQSAYKKLKAAP
ncbi:MAG: hypothetical protein J0H83_05865 [Candidatus Melainabacteria bacterium]|nr:hypothetical protein [Candidatus Melainabacteria bacterium]